MPWPAANTGKKRKQPSIKRPMACTLIDSEEALDRPLQEGLPLFAFCMSNLLSTLITNRLGQSGPNHA